MRAFSRLASGLWVPKLLANERGSLSFGRRLAGRGGRIGHFRGGPLTVSNGVTLTGSGFGAKPTAAALYFPAYDDYTTAQYAADTGLDARNTGYPPDADVNATRAHRGSRCLHRQYSGASAFPAISKSLAGGLDVYMAYWFFWTWDSYVGTPIFKLSRITASPLYHGTPSLYMTIQPGSDGIPTAGDTSYNDGVTTAPKTLTYNGPDINTWTFMEYRYRASTPGVADGFAKIVVAGMQTTSWDAVATRASGITAVPAYATTCFDGLDRVYTTTYDLWMDECYIDDSFARVVATDNATYASSTKFAPQRVSSWSDTAITIDAPNWSNFVSGETAYFHVFDGDDVEVAAPTVVVP